MVTTTNLIAYYKCDENAANTTVADAHGSFTGTAAANTSTMYDASGKINSALNFNGTSDTITGTPTPTAKYIAVNAWFKGTAFGSGADIYGAIFTGFRSSDEKFMFRRFNNTDNIQAQVREIGGTYRAVNSTGSECDGTWHMATIVTDGTNLELYIDGSSVGTVGFTETMTIDDSNMGVNSSLYWDGSLDEVSIWTTTSGAPLSSSDVTDLWNSGSGLAYPFVDQFQKTLTGTSRINVIKTKTLQGTARIQINDTEKVFDSDARIEIQKLKTLTGNSRINIPGNQKTLNGAAYIALQKTKTLTGNAFIFTKPTKTLTGTSRIEVTQDKTIVGTSRIEIQNQKTLTGTSRINIPGNQKTLTGTSYIVLEKIKTLTGTAFISIKDTFKPTINAINSTQPNINAINSTQPTFRSVETFN